MTNDQANFYARIWEISDNVKRLLSEFETSFENVGIKNILPSVEMVYMHEIIISLWMILGDSRHDKYRLANINKVFKNVELESIAATIIHGHKELIGKLDKNRNRISAHVDPRLVSLGFSDAHVGKLERTFKHKFPQLRAKNRTTERYTPIDMKNDLLEIKQILKDIDQLWQLIPASVATVDLKT